MRSEAAAQRVDVDHTRVGDRAAVERADDLVHVDGDIPAVARREAKRFDARIDRRELTAQYARSTSWPWTGFRGALGRFYSESFGVRVVCVRLGTVLPDDNPRSPQGGRGRSAGLPLSERFSRVRAKWLSHRDCCQLFARCIDAESVRYTIVYGTSNNPRQIWSLATARSLLKYEPQDAAPESLG